MEAEEKSEERGFVDLRSRMLWWMSSRAVAIVYCANSYLLGYRDGVVCLCL